MNQIESDLRIILSIQALRAFAYGFGSVIVGSVLAESGLRDAEVGAVFAAMLVGMAASSLAVGRWGERLGRRTMYVLLFIIFGIAGAAFATTTWLPLLIVAALTGTLSTDPNESGPITSLEQAMIGQSPLESRARIFGRYNAIAFLAGSFGSLFAGGPQALREFIPALPPDQRWLFLFSAVALLCVLLARNLSRAVEVIDSKARDRGPIRSAKTVRKLASLFALDAGAGGFVTQTFIVFWFNRRFSAGPELMALVFFGAGFLQALSSIAAARLATKIGYLNTMVFTHLPSNILLAGVAVAPSLGWGVTVLLLRFALSQMDVPARQAYITVLVYPEERTAAAAYTNTARYVARPIGPAAGGLLMERIALGMPFLVAGGLKILYDIAIFLVFRKVPLVEGEPRQPISGERDGSLPP